MQVESALLFETPVEIFTRVLRTLLPQKEVPPLVVEFRPFANANSAVRVVDGRLEVRITDLLQDAPSVILEALAQILLHKLFRRPAPPRYGQIYRHYLNRPEVRHKLQAMRQSRGRKRLREPQGARVNLEHLFDELNRTYFEGKLERPTLGWSHRASRTRLGHYDSSHNTIMLSRALDGPHVPSVAVEFVLFHEMLHLCFPVEHDGHRRCVHSAEFRAAEQRFPRFREAKQALRMLLA